MKIIIWILILWSSASLALYSQQPTSVSINSIKTDLGNAAIQIGVEYLNNLSMPDILVARKNSLLNFAPEVKLKTGEEDAFSLFVVKGKGFYLVGKDTLIDGVKVINSSKLLHVFPTSIGMETDNTFSNLNTIFEIGYMPWYQLQSLRAPTFIKRTKIGVFLQGGYKFKIDDLPSNAVGGDVVESLEQPNDPIFRLKSRLSFNSQKILKNSNGFNFGLIGTSNLWYDFLNTEVYYNIEAKLRLYLSKQQFFDFKYEKGSGAPNFNTGDQFGVGLTTMF